MKDWKEVKLNEIGVIIGGGTPSSKNESYYGGDISWITPKDLSKHTERYILKGERMITQAGLDASSAKLMPKGSVLFSSRAPIGYVAIAGKELCTNQGFKSIIPKKGISDSMFLYYLLKHRKKDIKSVASGTTFLEVSGSNMKNYLVIIPPLPEQKAIAATLSCLDDKIELNNHINKTLEEIAQAIFKSWFVDFEPFKDGEFEDSELGRIPKGWRVGKAEEFFNISIGKTPPRKEPQWFSENSSDVKWVSISDMRNCGVYILDTSEYLTNEAVEKHNVKVVPANTVILSFKLTVGRTAITSQEMTTNEAIAHFKTYKNNVCEFLYFYLNNYNYNKLGNTSSIAKAVNSRIIKAMPMMMPSEEILNRYHNLVAPLMNRIKKNQEENQTLSSIRDTLLPKLMSGEIRVPIE